MEAGLEVNSENYMLICLQNSDQNRDINISNRSSGNVGKLKYLETTVTDKGLIFEEIKSRFNSCSACYSIKKHLSSRLLSKNIKITRCRATILPVVLYGCDTTSLTYREYTEGI